MQPRRVASHRARRWRRDCAALTLCTAESLLATDTFDARDLIERFVRWQREGHCAATGTPPGAAVSPDVAKALATFLWRRLPMAGSHDPHDVAATSLPRTLAAASFALANPPVAVSLAAECSRPTHQSPVILDACRLQAAMLLGALQMQPASTWLAAFPVTNPPGLDPVRLHKDVLAAATDAGAAPSTARAGVLRVLPQVRHIVGSASTFDAALQEACATGAKDAALYAALTGTLFGAWQGFEALPAEALARLVGASQVEAIAGSVLQHARNQGVSA